MAAYGDESLLLHTYHHVVLPRDVPGREDSHLYQVEAEITRRLINATKQLALHAPPDDLAKLDTIRLMLSTCGALNVEGKIDKDMLAKELQQLENRQALVLHVTEQNAALLIYRHLSDDGTKMVVFETFEASATCKQVLAAEAALQWDFPGQAITVPHEIVLRKDFQQSLSAFVEQASMESIKQFSAVTYKACAPLPEIRDTADPTLITGALMTILKVDGTYLDVMSLRKRVRDTVSFDNAHKPWRRSAFYLVLRVAMQRHLYTLLGVEKGRFYFKCVLSIFMAGLLDDGLRVIPNEASNALRQKLGRRLAKLELDQERGSKSAKLLHSHIFKSLRAVMEKSLINATRILESQWEAHKKRTCRFIWPIQTFATSSDMTLRLPTSGQMLNRAMYYRFNITLSEIRSPAELLGHYVTSTALKPIVAITDRYLSLCKYEEQIAYNAQSSNEQGEDARCTQLARKIEAYVSTVHDAYFDYPEFKSRQLLVLMELWVKMDKHAMQSYPLLAKYHPGFDGAMMNVLQLSTPEEMRRLHDLQLYINKRTQAWCGGETKTIFASPAEDSFAVRYYDLYDGDEVLSDLRQDIEEDADENEAAKEAEWEEKSESHESKVHEMAGLSCVYITELDEHGLAREVHKKPCRKHKLKWEAKQITIDIFEYPLPKDEVALKATVFELRCPKPFAAYRDATWLILSEFAFPQQTPVGEVPLLRAYLGLREYANNTRSRITMGSSTKSHLDSHYAKSGFPVTFREINRPFGLKLDYYDTVNHTWTKRDLQPSFAHLFPMKIPPNSPYQSFEDVSSTWPTSNRILAAHTKCPADVNEHEYMAWQGLLLGTHLRWPSLLRELGSTNLSFSTESTWAIVSKVMLQVGPSSSNDFLRDVHAVFRDVTFCRKLLEQIDYRLNAIRRNWREPVQLDLLISMLLKVIDFSSSNKTTRWASDLLVKSRLITQDWSTSLHSAAEHEHGSGPSIFAIWAAVLCKRTFYASFKVAEDVSREGLVEFIVASITLQNCLAGAFDTLPYNLRNAVLRDLRLTFAIRPLLEKAVCTLDRVLFDVLKSFWPVPADSMNNFATACLDSTPHWVAMVLSAQGEAEHIVHYNFVRGTLLINGQQLGVLPSEYRRWPIIQELFGSQALSVLPSPLPGMSLVIDRQMPYDHWVHLGVRDTKPVIRATHKGRILELINPNWFKNAHHYDLPAALISECYHWLDLTNGILEIRQQDPWRTKQGNWRLNILTRQATRNNGSTLVDPNSELAKRIVQNFHQFEFSQHITVYQPARSKLRVELKRLELDFSVTQNGLLFCTQLGAVIAETRLQDVGTWHGLKSKLVLRSVKDYSQCSILLPLGETTFEREGPHVSIVIQNSGAYCKFGVNTVLGRIDCPAEPLLLYYRALWHAATSHFLPDMLTKRTGVEEALQYLHSGAYLPWSPLKVSACNVLFMVASLSPRRLYYPPTLKAMESVQWDSDLTTTIQDDRYRRVIEAILHRNAELSRFAPDPDALPPSLPVHGDTHLENRGLARIHVFPFVSDQPYASRDCYMDGHEYDNVAEVATMLSTWPTEVAITPKLASSFEAMPVIGGYGRSFDKIQITDVLNADLGFDWGALVTTAASSSCDDRFRLTFLFSLLAFSANTNMDLLRTIISFSLLEDLKRLALPEAPAYSHFRMYETPEVEKFVALMEPAKLPYVPCDSTPVGQLLMRQLDHEKDVGKALKNLAESIRAQWPSKSLDVDRLAVVKATLLDRDVALSLVLSMWDKYVDNFQFSQHIEEVQLVLFRHAADPSDLPSYRTRPATVQSSFYPLRMRGGENPSLMDILEKDMCVPTSRPASYLNALMPILKSHPNGYSSTPAAALLERPGATRGFKSTVPSQVMELNKLIAPYKLSSSMVHTRYGTELEHSVKALTTFLARPEVVAEPFNPMKLSNDLFAAKEVVRILHEQIRNALQEGDPRARWLSMAGLWPKVTPVTLLTELRTNSGVRFGTTVKETLVMFGLAITKYQRLLRIKDATDKGRRQQMLDESEHVGHTNWVPLEHVDWLILEIDGNILIRPEQVDVALATISPASRQNSVLQLLMGKGKTSCILPMVALELANNNLFRVVVPRPLLLQSAQIMQMKLGGLLDREVIHVPFSRKTPTDKALMQTYCRLHTDIQKQRGIVLALPEHILSFKLSGIQRLCDGKVDEAAMMIKAQSWLDRHARDVLDECDVSLAIRTQLIYPSGSQQTVDGHPLRWQTVEALLDLVASYLNDMTHKFPHSIEIVGRPGFPLIYFLRKDVEDYLISQIVQKISKGQTAILPVVEFDASSQEDILAFITSPLVDAEVAGRIADMFKENKHLVEVVYHLRGLFVHRILLSTLKKRWNVQYGLHPTRDPIAVPYQAKGVPSPTAEWGHPDVAIILTCLSFYYEGLNMAQFKQAIEHLAKSDEPSIEYSLWVAEDVPEAFKNYNAVNVEDGQQLRELHSHIKYKVCLLDFYLNSFVFPKHAKQFSKKLSASGADLILYEPTSPSCQTTGFSGTNDTRHQLPMTIKQNDLPQLAHTNAEVLAYLLEDRNRRYIRMVDVHRKRLTEEGLLKKLLSPGSLRDPFPRIRILIDAGAQILEHDNRSLVKLWLKIDHEAAGAVYFDEEHRARVIYGKGTDIPLVASPFAENLGECLVYIDESHCRGIDLKLPSFAKAALTLGPHLSKDALVQAAMRLRLLGKTQSVAFFSPPEVHQSILDLRSAAKASYLTDLSSFDVIRWLLEQSCNGIEQLEPLYFSQSINYLQRTQARLENSDFLDDEGARDAYLSVVRSKEMQTLRQLYEPKHHQRGQAIKASTFAPCLRPYVSEVLQRRKGFQDRGFAIHATALEEVEQEREMEFEVEVVREVQPPVHFKALKIARLHPDIEELATTGRVPAGSDAFEPMFCALQKTALGAKHGTIIAASTTARLYVSTQYSRTVSVKEPIDNFLRPCHWVLWSCVSDIGLIISPEEANALIPMLRHTYIDEPTSHLIVYSAPITRRMLQFNDVDYYAIPPLPSRFKAPSWLKLELGLFSGRLYFQWDEYAEIMSYLGMQAPMSEEDEDEQLVRREPFAEKPVAFLHEWLAIRRKGQDFEHTPMGFITTGKPLSANHPFFSADEKDEQVNAQFPGTFKTQMEEDEEESDDDDDDDDEDHAKEHLFQHDEGEDGHDEFHDAEEEFDEQGNTFFESGAYVHPEDKVEDGSDEE